MKDCIINIVKGVSSLSVSIILFLIAGFMNTSFLGSFQNTLWKNPGFVDSALPALFLFAMMLTMVYGFFCFYLSRRFFLNCWFYLPRRFFLKGGLRVKNSQGILWERSMNFPVYHGLGMGTLGGIVGVVVLGVNFIHVFVVIGIPFFLIELGHQVNEEVKIYALSE